MKKQTRNGSSQNSDSEKKPASPQGLGEEGGRETLRLGGGYKCKPEMHPPSHLPSPDSGKRPASPQGLRGRERRGERSLRACGPQRQKPNIVHPQNSDSEKDLDLVHPFGPWSTPQTLSFKNLYLFICIKYERYVLRVDHGLNKWTNTYSKNPQPSKGWGA